MIFNAIKKSRNLKNSFWNIAEVLLGPAILFVSIPIFLKQLGDLDYGVWMFVNTVITLMHILNLGLNYSTYKHISVAISEQKAQQIKDTLNTNLSLTFIISILAFFIVGVLAASIYYFNFFIDDFSIKDKLIICLFIGTIIIFTKLTEQILYNVYRAYEQFKYVTMITVTFKFITVLVNIILAIYTKNIVLILSFTALMALIALLVNYTYVKKFVKNYHFKFSLTKEKVNFEINYSLFVWLQSIVVILAYQGDRLLVSYGFGMKTLSYYAIIAVLFNHIHMAFAAITSWLFPQIAKNKDNKEQVFQMYKSARNISVVISILLLCLFSISSEILFTFWLGEAYYAQIAEYLKWFSIFEFFFIFTIIPHYFLNASGNEKFSLKIVSFYTFLNIFAMIFGYLVFKTSIAILIGLALSTVIGMVVLELSIQKKFSQYSFSVFKVLLLFIPSFFGSGTIYFQDYSFKFLSLGLCLLSIYLIYFKLYKTNFKLLFK